jgi:hypothetical protein
MVFKAVASRTGALLQCGGRSVRHIPSKSASEMVLEDGARRGVGPRLLVLLVRLLVVLDYTALAHWMSGSIPPLALQYCSVVRSHSRSCWRHRRVYWPTCQQVFTDGRFECKTIYGIRCISLVPVSPSTVGDSVVFLLHPLPTVLGDNLWTFRVCPLFRGQTRRHINLRS